MSAPLVAAALLLVGIGLAHSVLGERFLLMRLFRRPDLPRLFGGDHFTRRTLRFAWHVTSVAWWGFAALLFVLAEPGGAGVERVALRIVAGTCLATAAVVAIGSRGRHPAWLAFLAVAGLVWWSA